MVYCKRVFGEERLEPWEDTGLNPDKYYEIRDPIHGFITITDWERDIINHEYFQRLRRIRQLAFTDMVYPGAAHTRFEHSLGVMHLAGKAFDLITRNQKYVNRLKNVLHYNDLGIERARWIVRLAALLHDVGHGPFSHAAESLMPIAAQKSKAGTSDAQARYSHEQYSAAVIRIFFSDVIDGNRSLKTNAEITSDDVAGILDGDPQMGSHLFWRDLLTSQMDVDRMDYLLRDSYHCGVQYGRFDIDRLLHTLAVVEDTELEEGTAGVARSKSGLGLRLGVEEGGWHAAEELILARYAMFTQVYFHKTRRAYDYHLEQVLGTLLPYGFPPPDSRRNLSKFLKWDDWRVAGIVAGNKHSDDARRIRERNHYRRIYETVETPKQEDIEVFNRISDKLGSLVRMADSAAKSWYKFKKEEEIVVEMEDGSNKPLSDICPVVKGLRSIDQQRLYVDNADKEEALGIVAKVTERKETHVD
ncbi:MAG: HD domain-containing protein [Armatimonadota bacterium]|nr:HD domain-containing protein [Armatimonadota bacterium]